MVGAIPFGVLLTKIFCGGVDVRAFGSHNIGATNVTRVAGKKIGFFTFILDAGKGAVMVIGARFAFYDLDSFHLMLVVVGGTAILAHTYPVYLDFKGGKGVATSIGVLLAIDFNVGFLVICFWIMSFCLFRISSVSSLISIFSSIILSAMYDAPGSQIVFCCLLFILILVRHKENIMRLLVDEEKKIKVP